ncbi:hypothetical protein MHU86_23515 [Fragilaria crotonensis]|nr:hypothetical protein MHU86_23515 [Fragilaria crotonensis]
MYYATPSHLLQENQVEDGDGDSTAACFGSAAEYAAVQKNRRETALQVKEQALSAFKKRKVIVIANDGNDADDEQQGEGIAVVDNEDSDNDDDANDRDNYQYIVTIPSSKKTVMALVLRFISNGVTFRTPQAILRDTADVMGLTRTSNGLQSSRSKHVCSCWLRHQSAADI